MIVLKKTSASIIVFSSILFLIMLLAAFMLPIRAEAYSKNQCLNAVSTSANYTLQSSFATTAVSNYKSTAIKKGKKTIANTQSVAAIEADVKLSGKGTGRHAKLVICTPTAAVSFGIQWDKFARGSNHRKRSVLMIENIRHNNAGGQSYQWVTYKKKNIEVPSGKSVHLMLMLGKGGKGSVYVNGTKVGSYVNKNLNKQTVYLRVEGAARKNGDSVSASFKNIKLKNGGVYSPQRTWGTYEFTSNKKICATKATQKNVTIKGKISGWPSSVDWDTPGYFDKASGIIQFV